METNSCPQHVSSSTHLPSPLLKKTSPLKHVTPIIKKYDCQRQAKSGKSAKLKTQGKVLNEELTITNQTNFPDFVAGMDCLDAALRRAEKCMAGGKDQDNQVDDSMDHGLEQNSDDLGDVEEEAVSSSTATSNQQSAASNRSAHLRRNRVIKKRNQLQKDLDHALPLATPDQSTISEERSYVYAASYFQKVRDRFENKNKSIFDTFIKLMEDLDRTHCVTDLYHRILNLFEGCPDLCEEFLLFLLPKQAIQCGKFMEHLALTEMSSFLRKLELCFAKQPQHLRKIHASWARLAEPPDVTLETVRSTILPLLRGNTFLVESFLELFPSEKPAKSKMTDFDIIVCDDIDSEHSGEEETFERVEIPAANDEPYGGENCQCCCHTSSDPAFTSRTKHCTACGIKFISGKVFMQTEHGLRPVKIEFGAGTMGSNIKRLNANHQKLSRARSRRGRTGITQMSVKSEDGKQSVETDDEAAFLKVKSPRQRPKISKPGCEKVSSSRSLALGRIGARKPAAGKMGSPPQPSFGSPPQPLLGSPTQPLFSDQDAMAAPDSSGDVKGPNLDFSNLANVLRTEQVKSDEEGPPVSSSNICHADPSESNGPGVEADIDEIKEEDGISCGAGKENKECKEAEITRREDFAVNSAPEDISMDEVDEKDEESGSDAVEGSVCASVVSSDCEMEGPGDDTEGASWTRDEDRIILCTFQSEPDKGQILERINEQLPHRTVDEISNRFKILMNLIQQMQ